MYSFDIHNDQSEVIIDFKHARVFDHSGIEAINMLTERYKVAEELLV